MFEVAVVVAASAAAVSTMRRSIRTKRSMLPSGVVLWAVACALQLEQVYGWIDPLIGGNNATNVIYRVMAIVALGCLEVMVIRATRGRGRREESVVAAVVALIAGLQILLFFLNDWRVSDTYLSAYGGQLGREVFWNLMPLCVAAFSIHVLLTVGSEWRAHSVRATRWGLALIGLAACVDLLWVTESLVTSVLRMVSDPSLLLGGGADAVAQALLATMVVCTGLGVAVASAEPLVDSLWMRILLIRALPIWWKVVRAAPRLSVTGTRGLVGSIVAIDVEPILYRRWVEILDGERARVFTPTARQRHVLESIGDSLGGTTPSDRDRSYAGLSGLLSMSR